MDVDLDPVSQPSIRAALGVADLFVAAAPPTSGASRRGPEMRSEEDDDVVEQIAIQAEERSLRIACAESLTAGAIASALARGSGAASWFAGGVVSYMSDVKFDVLGVAEGPVITASCAEEMVAGVSDLLGADAAVAVTGAGGPDEEEGQQPGTVYIATRVDGRTEVDRHQFAGDPPDVLDQTVDAAIDRLAARLGD